MLQLPRPRRQPFDARSRRLLRWSQTPPRLSRRNCQGRRPGHFGGLAPALTGPAEQLGPAGVLGGRPDHPKPLVEGHAVAEVVARLGVLAGDLRMSRGAVTLHA